MKRCKKCNLDYSDIDNFCIECGKKLERVAPQLPAEFEGMQSRIDSLEGIQSSIKDLESKVSKFSDNKIKEVESKIESKMNDFESSIKNLDSKLSEIQKKTGESDEKMKRLPIEELIAMMSDIGEVKGKADRLENRVESIRQYELPEDIVDISKNKKSISGAKRDISNLSKEFEKSRDKMDAKIASIPSFPKNDMISMVSQIGELENNIEDIKNQLAAMRKTKLPEDIINIDKNTKRLSESAKRMADVKKKLEDNIGKTEYLANRIKLASETMTENANLVRATLTNVEKRSDARLDAADRQGRALLEAQRRLEKTRIDITALEKRLKKNITEGILRDLRGLVS